MTLLSVLKRVTNLCGHVGRCSAFGGVVLLCLYVSHCELHCVHDILSCLSVSHFGSEYQEGFFVTSCGLTLVWMAVLLS
jgi:hypothetical protein